MPSDSLLGRSWAKLRRRLLTHYRLVRAGLLVLTLAIIIFLFGGFILPFLRLGKEVLFGPVNIFSVVFPRQQELKSDHGRTNILLLGIGDPGHDGPNLTDTMIVVSLKYPPESDSQTATAAPTLDLISIPRDIYSDSLGQKINAAYAVGQEKGSGVGLVLAKATVSQITGLPIHYAVRVDFSVFENIIDLAGGIDINVEHSFEDKQYPVDGKENDLCDGDPEFKCRYQTVSFLAGPQHMDGKTALIFVRSRHAQGLEGTDFARSRRQQLVIEALKSKLFSTNLLLDPSKLLSIYNQFKSHIDTDFSQNDVNNLVNLALKFRLAKFKNIVLDLNSDLLVNPPPDERGWILLPKDSTWEKVHQYIQTQLEKDQ